jgi:hypothetical protein
VETDVESGAVRFFSSKRRVVAVAVVILLGLFLLRPGVSRLKARIAASISRAVARPVDIGSVHIRFLPRPGFDLENLVVYEDPAFGAEPMLRAPEVTAVVRLTSLVRGRLDISRLELTEPSLNLVRRPDGRWNWEALLERTARSPLAPTAKSRSEARPGFPYIEASSGRINFKAGAEKKPYALLNADFALWQESENAWGVRLRAEPLRTDMSLSDTGVLRMNGIWQRAGSLRETPLQFSVEWQQAQLGQLTKLVLGSDKGWRGAVRIDATMSGSPAAMQVTADASLQDFHRYDISTGGGETLAAHCDGKYRSVEKMMREIACSAPVGDGAITLHGDAGLPGIPMVDLSLNVDNVPMNAVTNLARRLKKSLPADLVSLGTVQGTFTAKEDAGATRGVKFAGQGDITGLRLQSDAGKTDFATASIPFILSSGTRRNSSSTTASELASRNLNGGAFPAPDELHVEFGPFAMPLGRPAAAQARGWISRSGYGMSLRGDGEVSHALRSAGLLGLPAIKTSAEGAAQMDLRIAASWGGSWSGSVSGSSTSFSPPEVTGTVQLHNVRATMRGVNGPIEISSAELRLLPDEVRLDQLSAKAADARWTGSVSLPRGCGVPGACLIRFNLNADEISFSALHEWLSSHPKRRRWYQILNASEPAASSFLANLRASGKVNASRFLIRNVTARQVSAAIDMQRGKLKISNLRADLLGGTYRGDWNGDFTEEPPVYAGSATLEGISLQQLADAMHDAWISGTASGTYQFSASGADLASFWQSAEGGLQFDLRDGVLPHIRLTGAEDALRIARWEGSVHLRKGKFEIEKGELFSSEANYEVSGTASLSRVLDFKLARSAGEKSAAGSMVYSITGTVAEPRVELSPAPETQAQLKP